MKHPYIVQRMFEGVSFNNKEIGRSNIDMSFIKFISDF